MLIALEIRTVVYLTLCRAAYIFYFKLDNKNRRVLPRWAQSQWFKSSCNASVFQPTSYQKKKIFNKDRNALWNWDHLNSFSIQTQVQAHSVNKSFLIFPTTFESSIPVNSLLKHTKTKKKQQQQKKHSTAGCFARVSIFFSSCCFSHFFTNAFCKVELHFLSKHI